MARPRSNSPPLFEIIERPDFSFEKRAMAEGQWPVAGLDEAGRGPLAGPVVAAAVILDPETNPGRPRRFETATAEQREALFDIILGSALGVSMASVCAEGIDRDQYPARPASRRCGAPLAGLPVQPQLALADGRDVPPGLPCPGRALVKGDQRSQSIAAASIVAKVMRDRMMQGCGQADRPLRVGGRIWATRPRATAPRSEFTAPSRGCTASSFSPFRLGETEMAEAD